MDIRSTCGEGIEIHDGNPSTEKDISLARGEGIEILQAKIKFFSNNSFQHSLLLRNTTFHFFVSTLNATQ